MRKRRSNMEYDDDLYDEDDFNFSSDASDDWPLVEDFAESELEKLLREVSMCPAVSPDRRMSYVEIQMDWALYDKIKTLFP
jgi:hypothetical protein